MCCHPLWYFPTHFLSFPLHSLSLFLYSPNEWEHIMFVLLWLTYFTQHNKFHPRRSKWWVFVVSNGWGIFHWIHRPQLCSTTWNLALWCPQIWFSFLKFPWLFGVFSDSTQIFLFLKDFIYLFMRDIERQRHRQREKRAPCREPDVGLDTRIPGSRPEPKVDAQLLSHRGIQ